MSEKTLTAYLQKKAYDALARRAHSEQELRQKLNRRPQNNTTFEDVSEEAWEGVVERLLQDFVTRGFLDDQEFAEQYIRSILRKRPCGRSLLWKRLQERGVAETVSATALDIVYPKEQEYGDAQQVAQKKANLLPNTPKKQEKLARFLHARGFAQGLIWEILEKDAIVAPNN